MAGGLRNENGGLNALMAGGLRDENGGLNALMAGVSGMRMEA